MTSELFGTGEQPTFKNVCPDGCDGTSTQMCAKPNLDRSMFVHVAGTFKSSQLRRALPALVMQRYEEAKIKVCSLHPWVGGDGDSNDDGDSE